MTADTTPGQKQQLKIIFVNLDQGHFNRGLVHKVNRAWTPYEIGIMAAMQVNAGHEVRVIDANACGLTNNTVIEQVKANAPDILLLASQPADRWQNPFPTIAGQVDFCQNLRSSGFEGKIISFGPHPTLLPDHYLQSIPECDYIVRGEPEVTVDELVRCLAQGNPPESVEGISEIIDGIPKHHGSPQRIGDLNDLPLPAYDLLPMERYQHHFYSQVADPAHRFAYIETNRGCPFACSFCNLALYGKKLRRFRIDRVLAEIDVLVQNYGVNYIFFGDLTFGIHKKDTKLLLQGLIERNYPLTWSCQTRVDICTPEMVELMKKAGCRRIEAGVESADPSLIEDVKRVQIKKLYAFVEMLKVVGIKLEPGHLIGLPGQKKKHVNVSARILRKAGVRFKISGVTLAYPGTPDYLASKNRGEMYPETWEDVVTQAGKCGNDFTDRELRALIRRWHLTYHFYILVRGLPKVIIKMSALMALVRSMGYFLSSPSHSLGAVKRILEDAVYGDE